MPLSPHRHFERKREIFFVRDRSGKVRTADSGKHHTLCDVGSRCFMQTALRRKRETGNEKDPSAAPHRVSQPPPLRGTSFRRKEGEEVKPIYPLPVEGGCPKGRGLAEGKKSEASLCLFDRLLAEEGECPFPVSPFPHKEPPCFLRFVLISYDFFPRRSSPVIMDRDSRKYRLDRRIRFHRGVHAMLRHDSLYGMNIQDGDLETI